LEQIEEEKKMPYVTSVERLAKEEGREEGREAGILIGQILLLQKQLRDETLAKPELELMSSLELSRVLEQLLSKAENLNPESR